MKILTLYGLFLCLLLTSLSVQAANSRPTISGEPNTVVQPNGEYSFQPSANDVDGDSLSFFIENKPAWAFFSESTGELSGEPTLNDRGRYASISIGVTDGTAIARLPRFTLVVINNVPEIGGIPEDEADIGTEYSFFPQASDLDGDTLLFSIRKKPVWATFDVSDGSLVGVPRRADDGELFSDVIISVDDGYGGKVSLPPFSILVNANSVPVIDGTPSPEAAVGVMYSFNPEASDADGDLLTFSIRNRPGWVSIDAATGALTGVPRRVDGGRLFEDIVISVDDGKGGKVSLPPFSIEVTNNTAPTISGEPSTEILAGSTYQFTPIASDDDGDPLTFLIEGLPTWATFDSDTGQLQGTPGADDRGRTEAAIRIGVTDGMDTVFLGGYRINIRNNEPIISGEPLRQVLAGSLYQFMPMASDDDGDSLTFLVEGLPVWATFDSSTGLLQGTPRAEDRGRTEAVIRVGVTDGMDTTFLGGYRIDIRNNAPEISGVPETTVKIREEYSFVPTVSDFESDSLIFTIRSKPVWAEFDTTTGELTGMARNEDVGKAFSDITILVNDGNGGRASLPPFTIQVDSNAVPSISGEPLRQVQAGSLYQFLPTASDDDDDLLTFLVEGLPVWATFDSSTGLLQGTPRAEDRGRTEAVIRIGVTDGVDTIFLGGYRINVRNNAPTINGEPLRQVQAGSLYQFLPTASDDDDDSLTFLVEGLPEWATFDNSTGELLGTPGAEHRGQTEAVIRVGVTDGTDTVYLRGYRISIGNNPPVISGEPSSQVLAGSLYQFLPIASDDDDDSLTFLVEGLPEWATFDTSTGQLQGTPGAEDRGQTEAAIRIGVTDGVDTTFLGGYRINIRNNPPVISGEPPRQVQAGGLYQFMPVASDVEGDSLTFLIEGKPEWASFDENSGLLSGSPEPTDRGRTEAAIKIGVTDGASTSWLSGFRIRINNNVPTLAGDPERVVDIAELYSFIPVATDIDGDTLIFRVANLPSWLQFDSLTGELSGTPSAADEGMSFDNIILSVADRQGGRAEIPPFSISINMNDAPVIIGEPPTSVLAESSYSFVPEVTDTEGDPIQFFILNKPDWADFNETTGELSGIPTSDQRGRYRRVRIGVTDGKEESLTDTFIIHVLNNNPEISGTPSNITMPSESYDFTPEVIDLEEDSVRFIIRNKPRWAEFDATTGRLYGVSRTIDEREVFPDITITVIDEQNGRATLPAFEISVIESNRVPYLSGKPENIAPTSELYSFQPRVRDENTESQLIFNIQNKPDWLSFDTETGLLSGVPTPAEEGIYANIIISVDDERGGSASLEPFEITVDRTAMTRLQAYRLLTQTTFGPTSEDLDMAMSMTPEDWLESQFIESSAYDVSGDDHMSHLERVIEIAQTSEPTANWFDNDGIFNKESPTTAVMDYHMATWLENVLEHPTKLRHGQDQLRQRIAYALSQLLVVSEFAPPLHVRGEALANYYDILARNAFGNYRDILGEVARSPTMGIYLSHQGNGKTDLLAATLPDENFAREIIQLFTVGLYELNLDGSADRDGDPNSYPDEGSNIIPTYTQADVTEMAKVMTGWDLVGNVKYGLSRGKQGDYTVPMEFTAAEHENEADTGGDGLVTVMGQTFALNSGSDGSGLDSALDILYAHPNIAPFVSKHLIMRLVTSNPSANYVARVATVFNDNGLGVKGDLKAVVEAILLDAEAREPQGIAGGKAREPLIAMMHFLRAHKVSPVDGWISRDGETPVNGVYWYRKPQRDLGQAALRSPSVFNFYDAEFVPSDTFFSENQIAAPEFQIQTEQMLVEFHNQVARILETSELNQITRIDGESLEDFVSDKDYFFGQALLLIDLSEELVSFEQSLEGDDNGDFSLIHHTNPETYLPYKEKAVDDLLDHLNQVLLGGRMTSEYHAGLKHYLIDGDSTKNSDAFTEALSTIRDAIRYIVTSSAFMIHE